MRRIKSLWCVALTVTLVVTLGLGLSGTAEAGQWVTAWGSSQHSVSSSTLTNTTVRMIARSTIAGDFVRVKLQNRDAVAVTFEEVWVGLVNRGPVIDFFTDRTNNGVASLALGSNRQLTFDEDPDVTIDPGGAVISDPVAMRVEAQQDVAVSLYVPGTDVQPSSHSMALTTSYLATGNEAANEEFYLDILSPFTGLGVPPVFTQTTNEMFWLTAIDVYSDSPGAIVAFGDSITDGFCATADGWDRWEDVLALRLREAAKKKKPDAHRSVVNEGINGNTITRGNGALVRLDQDVLSLAGVTHVILFMGTNDLSGATTTANDVIAGMMEVINRVKASGAKIIGVTIIPRHPDTFFGAGAGFTPAENAERLEVNRWIRDEAPFDAVLDFDEVVRDPNNPDLMRSAFDCDGIHPNIFGYDALGRSINLKVFKRGRGRRRGDDG
jgi:lysophospholipase L1-like esterase